MYFYCDVIKGNESHVSIGNTDWRNIWLYHLLNQSVLLLKNGILEMKGVKCLRTVLIG